MSRFCGKVGAALRISGQILVVALVVLNAVVMFATNLDHQPDLGWLDRKDLATDVCYWATFAFGSNLQQQPHWINNVCTDTVTNTKDLWLGTYFWLTFPGRMVGIMSTPWKPPASNCQPPQKEEYHVPNN